MKELWVCPVNLKLQQEFIIIVSTFSNGELRMFCIFNLLQPKVDKKKMLLKLLFFLGEIHLAKLHLKVEEYSDIYGTFSRYHLEKKTQIVKWSQTVVQLEDFDERCDLSNTSFNGKKSSSPLKCILIITVCVLCWLLINWLFLSFFVSLWINIYSQMPATALSGKNESF